MKHLFFCSYCLLFILNPIWAKTEVRIVSLNGDVQVRYALDEKWHKAAVGDVLKDIDTIFNGENASSTLKLDDGTTFRLGPNSVLDISDLREILEKEMFLFLMSKKVDKIEHKNIKTELRVGNVSVIHGSDVKENNPASIADFQKAWSQKEINGAQALYEHNFFSNSIIKLHNILSRYDTLANREVIYLYMAKGFEALDKKGQAIDAYQKLINILTADKNKSEENIRKAKHAQLAIENLSQ